MTETRPASAAIPPAALVLALAGLVPFLWGAATMLLPAIARAGDALLPGFFAGPELQVRYGVIILCFMAGVFWGFAARAEGPQATRLYLLSVLPALYIFFNLGTTPQGTATALLIGFAGLLAIDWHAWRAGLAPAWWMRLRLPVTATAALTLLPVILT
jgi:hypothetical protein